MNNKENQRRILFTFLVHGELDKVTYIGPSLEEPLKGKLIMFLQVNDDVFSWMAADMPRIDPGLITHKLNVDHNRKMVK